MKKTILLLLLPILFCSCNNKQNNVGNLPSVATLNNGLVACDISLARNTFLIPITRLLDQVDIIVLEESDDALIKRDGHVTASENYIGISSSTDGVYKLFERNGKFLRNISKRGNGPNELAMSLYDSYIDEDNHRIYLLPLRGNKILVYDLEGKPLDPIPLPYLVHKGRFKIDNEKKEVTLAVLPFPDSPAAVWKQDFKGNIIQEIPANHLTINHLDYSNEQLSGMNTDAMDFAIGHWVAITDTLYHYDDNANLLKPVFTATYNQEIPQHDYIELPNHYIIQYNMTPTSDPLHLIVDKETLTGFYADFKMDMLGGINISWINFRRGYYVENMYPHELMEQLEAITHEKEIDTNVEKLLNHISNW